MEERGGDREDRAGRIIAGGWEKGDGREGWAGKGLGGGLGV
jgi:hypothetical protein